MKLTTKSTIADVAVAVTGALKRENITAVLTGGACATIHSDGAYQSHDLDFIIRTGGTRKSLDHAMASIGFSRDHDRYVHPSAAFFVEFPRGPLAIGDDVDVTPVELTLDAGTALALSPTDSCRDRLAAFYHWSDRQGLSVAVEIAVRARVDMKTIERWSKAEGFEARFEEFRSAVSRRKRERR